MMAPRYRRADSWRDICHHKLAMAKAEWRLVASWRVSSSRETPVILRWSGEVGRRWLP